MAMNLKTDGKYYELNELVRANCQECVGCCDCCVGMGDTIVLDPYDVWMLKRNLQSSMQALLADGKLSLTVVDGLVVPHLKMDETTNRCPYLSGEGRCRIHEFRPGMCRLFPLGRNYADGKLNYILLTEECKRKQRSKIKVSQWIGIKPAEKYHEFVLRWHDFRKKLCQMLMTAEDEQAKEVAMYVLQAFYFTFEAAEDEFFDKMTQKLDTTESVLGL